MKSAEIFNKLWEEYTHLNPSTKEIHDLFVKEGEDVSNDHIALRTFNNWRINIDVLARPFIHCGYIQKGHYIFKDKKLEAKHFANPSDVNAPLVFISQLQLEKFSKELQATINKTIDSIDDKTYYSENLIYQGRPWQTPSYETYNWLREESEYAAWVYVFGFRANHFTVSVNSLKKFKDIKDVNSFIKSHGYLINDSGGEIKGNPEMMLEQSSTLASNVEIEFAEGSFKIPACYYEFAKRYKRHDGKIFKGFIAGSADKIFESTDYYD